MRFASRALAALSITVFAVLVLSTSAGADDVTTTAGKKITGKLVSVDANGITFATPDAKVPIPAREIVVVDLGGKAPPPPKEPHSIVELTDGSTFLVSKYALKKDKFELELFPTALNTKAPTYDIPMTTVFSAMKRAEDPKQREAWSKIIVTRGKRDLYVTQQETGLNPSRGTIKSGSEDGKFVSFVSESGSSAEDLLQSRAVGFVFYQAQPGTIAPTICRVIDVFGNALTATKIVIEKDGEVTVTTVAGATVKYVSAASIAKLDYQLGNVAYLSDIDPLVDAAVFTAEEARLNPTLAFLKDRSLSNDLLKLDNLTYPKGLCIAPDTVLTYNLKNDYTQFKALAGIDENGSNATSTAKLTIEGDGQVLFSGTLKRKDKPREIVLAIKGVKQLRVLVEADTPLNGNYVTLADARVQK